MINNPPLYQNPEMDGNSFFWENTTSKNTAILLIHGFTATTVEVKLMAKYLYEKGFSVCAPLLPGHGLTPEELNKKSYDDWIETVNAAYLNLKKGYKNIFVLGESMGGLLSLYLASKYNDIRGIMLFAPALKIHKIWEANFVWPFKPYQVKKNIDLKSPWQGYTVVPLHAASQLNKLQKIIRRKLRDITQPILIFQGKLDTTIEPSGAVEVFENIRSEEKQFFWLKDSSHCILIDKELDFVEETCLEFIQSQIA